MAAIERLRWENGLPGAELLERYQQLGGFCKVVLRKAAAIETEVSDVKDQLDEMAAHCAQLQSVVVHDPYQFASPRASQPQFTSNRVTLGGVQEAERPPRPGAHARPRPVPKRPSSPLRLSTA